MVQDPLWYCYGQQQPMGVRRSQAQDPILIKLRAFVMIINSATWARIVAPIHTYSSAEFQDKLQAMYGIEHISPETNLLSTSWKVTFVDERARIMFMLK